VPTFAVTDNSAFLSVYVDYTLTTNQANNQTTVSATIRAVKTSNQTATTGTSTLNITIDGTTYTDASVTRTVPAGPSDTPMFTASKVVTHNANGSKTIVISVGGGLPQSSWTTTTGSASIDLTDFIYPPSAPSGAPTLSRSSNGTSITITSQAATPDNNGPITDYRVQTSTDGSSWYSIAGTLNANTSMGVDAVYTYVGANALTTYYFRTFARASSAPTAYQYGPVSASSSIVGIPSAPATITLARTGKNVLVTAGNATGTGITGYYVQASSNDGSSWSTAELMTSQQYNYTTLTSGLTYIFRVYAVNSIGSSAFTTSSSLFVSSYGYKRAVDNTWTALQSSRIYVGIGGIGADANGWRTVQNVKRYVSDAGSGSPGWIDLTT